MATVSAFSPLNLLCHRRKNSTPTFSSFTFRNLRLRKTCIFASPLSLKTRRLRMENSVQEETQVSSEQQEEEEAGEVSPEQQAVVVPVSPSDTLTMFFQAEGTMSESAIPTVTKSLEETDGISDLKVQIAEGIASVEFKKQTTVQATGVASGLVEAIQGSGFKLQTLNLSFDDDDQGTV